MPPSQSIRYYLQHGFDSFRRYSHSQPDLSILPLKQCLIDDIDRIVSDPLQFRLELFPQLQTLSRDQHVRFEISSRRTRSIVGGPNQGEIGRERGQG